MDLDIFNLKWVTYTDHLRKMLQNMMSSNEMTDITLVTEDKKQFKAHKVVLSACSSLFRSIISDSISTYPIIYLRGVQSMEIESILHFLYLGEATVHQERMNELFNVAKILGVEHISKDINPTINEQSDYVEKWHIDDDNELLKTDSMPEQIINMPHKKKQLKKKYVSEKKHLCDQCSYKTDSAWKVLQHIRAVHEGVKYPCDQCSFKSTQMRRLKEHIRFAHDGVKYTCDRCNHNAPNSSGLKKHIKFVHDGAKYPCDQCIYMTTRPDNLRKHIKLVHKSVE